MTRVCVVDDDEAVRSALCLLLRAGGYRPAAYASAEEFLTREPSNEDLCLVLDVRMPGLSGLELMQRLAARGALPPVLVLTGHADVPLAVEAMKRGASDLLEKPFSDTALLDAVERAGQTVATRREQNAHVRACSDKLASLTPRERDVMARIIKGCANKVIAIDLQISERTVEIHRSNVMKKTGTRSIAELVQLVMGVAVEV